MLNIITRAQAAGWGGRCRGTFVLPSAENAETWEGNAFLPTGKFTQEMQSVSLSERNAGNKRRCGGVCRVRASENASQGRTRGAELPNCQRGSAAMEKKKGKDKKRQGRVET